MIDFQFPEPLRIKIIAGDVAKYLDVYELDDAYTECVNAANREQAENPQAPAWYQRLREWLAKKLDVPIESLYSNQVMELADRATALATADYSDRKKKLETGASSPPPTLASPATSAAGPNPSETPG